MSNLEDKCPFCLKPLGDAECAKLYQKGCDTINKNRKFHEKKIPEV